MILVEPKVEIISMRSREEILKHIEKVGRIAYKSENKITKDSAEKFVSMLVKRGHLAVLEHESITFKVITNRGVSHEIVRHRMASYCQESTRYCNYNKCGDITICIPSWMHEHVIPGRYTYCDGELYADYCDRYDSLDIKNTPQWVLTQISVWQSAENAYKCMIELGCTPQQARGVLPNDTKTEIMITMNLRELIHFINLRSKGTTGAPHPDMKVIADMLYNILHKELPEVFE